MNEREQESKVYQIRIKESLDSSWSEWFEGIEISHEKSENGSEVTLLTGELADQSALNGLLNKLWGLNLTVISVEQINTN